MEFNLKNVLKTLLSFLLAALFLYAAFRGTNVTDLWDSIRTADYLWVLLLLPFIVLSFWLRALRWQMLLRPVKAAIPMRNLFGTIMIGYAVNNLLPRVGEFVRPVALGNMEKISRTAVFGTVVVERILDFLTFYFITCITLFLYPNALDPFVDNVETVRPLLLLGSLAGFAVFGVLFFKVGSFVRFVSGVRRFLPEKYRTRAASLTESFMAGFGVSKDRRSTGVILSLSLLLWVDYALIMYIPFYSFPALRVLDFGAAVVLLVITSVAWVLPAPGAMGTYHSFLTVALTKLYGIDSVTALSFSIVTHEVGYLFIMVLGGYYFFRDHLSMKEIRMAETPEPREEGPSRQNPADPGRQTDAPTEGGR